MTNPIKYTSPGSLTLAIAGDSSSPTLKNASSNALVLSNAISSSRDKLSDWRLRVRCTSAPTAGLRVIGWFILDVADQSAYEDGGTSVEPVRQPDLIFLVRNDSGQQVLSAWGIQKPNCAFKVLLKNATGQALTNTDNENQLHYTFYNDEVT